MARGMVNGEPIVSQAQTKAFDEGFERTFGADRKVERGRFIYDPELGRCVPAAEYHERRALDAPVMAGRFYENVVATDGTDIGTRAKREEYMRKNGLADPSDFTQHLAQKRAERDRFYQTGFGTAEQEKSAKQAADRALHEIVDARQKDYDHTRARREAERTRRGKGFTP